MALHLDSSVVIAWSRGRDEALRTRFAGLDLGSLSLSFVVDAELRVGLAKSRYPGQHERLLTFLEAVRIAHSSPSVVRAYVETRSVLERTGLRIGENDLWIAATALSEGAALATLNVRELARVPGLVVEDWSA